MGRPLFPLITLCPLLLAALSLWAAAAQDSKTLNVSDRWLILYFAPLLLVKLHLPHLFPSSPHSVATALRAATCFSLPFLPLVLHTDRLGGADWKFFVVFSYIYGCPAACRMLLTASCLFLLMLCGHYLSAGAMATYNKRRHGDSGFVKKQGTTSTPFPFFPYLAAAALGQLFPAIQQVFSH